MLVFSGDLRFNFVQLYPYSRHLGTLGLHRVVRLHVLLESSTIVRQADILHTYQLPAG